MFASRNGQSAQFLSGGYAARPRHGGDGGVRRRPRSDVRQFPGRRRRGGARTRRPARPPETDCQRELRVAGGAGRHGQPAHRQVRRGRAGAPVLRRLWQCRRGGAARGASGVRAVRRRARLRATAQRRRRQPGRLLGHPGDARGAAAAGRAAGQVRAGAERAGLAAAARGAGQPAPVGHGPGRRRPPDPRLPAERIRAHVRVPLLRRGPGQRPARLRRAGAAGAGAAAADPAGRLQLLSRAPSTAAACAPSPTRRGRC